MLLADLGADVIKVEPPAGDAWRRYEPFDAGESRYFYALNRNKRSVVLDLKTDAGRRASRALIAGADAVLHNFPPERAPSATGWTARACARSTRARRGAWSRRSAATGRRRS